MLGKSRKRIAVRGLGMVEVRQTDPSVETEFTELGYLDSSSLADVCTIEEIIDETGNVILAPVVSQRVELTNNLLQSTADEINLLRNAVGMTHAIRYSGTASGRYLYICFEAARINPSVSLEFASAPRKIALKTLALSRTDEAGYAIPIYYVDEGAAEMLTSGLHLLVNPRAAHNAATPRILDMSGFQRHGLVSDTAIWQYTAGATPERFLRFDGTNDSVDFGNILNDDASGDFMIEMWLKFPGGGGTQEEVLSKKALVSNDTAGYAIYRNTVGQVVFRIGSGATSSMVTTAGYGTSSWAHYAILIDRNGNAQAYINGATSGSASSVSSIATGTNALSLYLGRDGTNFGQVDIGHLRIHRWLTGGLPSNITTVISNHYTATRAFYGV